MQAAPKMVLTMYKRKRLNIVSSNSWLGEIISDKARKYIGGISNEV